MVIAAFFGFLLAAIGIGFLALQGGDSAMHRGTDVKGTYRVVMFTEAEYRTDTKDFAITDTMELSPEASAAICGRRQGDDGTLNDCVRSAVEKSGWTYAGIDSGRPTFVGHRRASGEVPWWPLTVTRSIDLPAAYVDGGDGYWRLIHGPGSEATITGPKRLIKASSPAPASTELLLDERDSESLKLGLGDRRVDEVRLKLVSPIARNPIVAPLLNFSLWGTANWIVLVFAAMFQEQVRAFLRRSVGAVARRVGWPQQPPAPTAPPVPVNTADCPPSAQSTVPAAWYPDPERGEGLRYWDGSQWTRHTSPVVSAAKKNDGWATPS